MQYGLAPPEGGADGAGAVGITGTQPLKATRKVPSGHSQFGGFPTMSAGHFSSTGAGWGDSSFGLLDFFPQTSLPSTRQHLNLTFTARSEELSAKSIM